MKDPLKSRLMGEGATPFQEDAEECNKCLIKNSKCGENLSESANIKSD
jgi:hypothetical protein